MSDCEIYANLSGFEVTNNLLCPPYPDCFEFIGYQNTENCTPNNTGAEDTADNIVDNREIVAANDVSNISAEYFQYDLEILQSFIDNNESLNL